MEKRLSRARRYLRGLDAILLLSRPSITYLSGYTGSDALYLFTEEKSFLFVDSRNTLQAMGETRDEVREFKRRWEDILEVLREEGVQTMGLESNILDIDSFLKMKDLYRGIEMTPMGTQLRNLRSIKDETETAAVRKAASISEEALEKVLEKGLAGRREIDVSLDLEWEMRTRGASGTSFELLIASGTRSAMPHGAASDRVIGGNEVVIIDFGCVYNGYCSDQTVTVLTGSPPDGFSEAYQKVHEAQARAMKAVAPGVKASDVDRIARDHLASGGLSSYFGHGLGHGVGREVHEAPTVSPLSEDLLEEGMVITIEPGVYMPGRYGIRLEDMVLVTDNSCKRLTNLDKGIIRNIS
ncbi:MAG TPA: aminopeptidase P family protein [Deltaproteobacteria bacterium]|nr:aminopeptidase P family protein [Deltaproteobacteria bacterium]HPR53585.1 aminopeptidase P family protein [Deltaproteobacteria bacterium]HXK47100.1 aminopeptidase P family protein [Deltaproteobacteria bacterium]